MFLPIKQIDQSIREPETGYARRNYSDAPRTQNLEFLFIGKDQKNLHETTLITILIKLPMSG